MQRFLLKIRVYFFIYFQVLIQYIYNIGHFTTYEGKLKVSYLKGNVR